MFKISSQQKQIVGYMRKGLTKYQLSDSYIHESNFNEIFNDFGNKEEYDYQLITKLQQMSSFMDAKIHLHKAFLKTLHPTALAHPFIIKGKYIKPKVFSNEEIYKVLQKVGMDKKEAKQIVENLNK